MRRALQILWHRGKGEASAVPLDDHIQYSWTLRTVDLQVQRLKAIPSLDGIRAISVLIVVLGHSGLGTIVPGGLGVTIFFFLSGYLISSLMLAEHERTGKINILHFYARRLFRLMPPLVITLAIAYALTYSGWLTGGITSKGLAAQLLYCANYYGLFFDPGNTVPDGTGILWSLAVEEHFYIIYPFFMILLLGTTLSLRTIAGLLGLMCVAVLAWRIHLVHVPGFFPERTYYASDTRIDSIIYGCILALVMDPARKTDRPCVMSLAQWALLASSAIAILLTLVYREPAFRETARYTIQGLALMPFFYSAVRFSGNGLFRYLNTSWLMTLGTYSYSIYLIHYIFIRLIDTNMPTIGGRPYLVFPAALLISSAYAAALALYVEPYFKGLRRKFR